MFSASANHQYSTFELAPGKLPIAKTVGKMATFVPMMRLCLSEASTTYVRHKYTLDQAVQASTPTRARCDLSKMSKDILEAYVASHGFGRRKFGFGSCAVLLQRAKAI